MTTDDRCDRRSLRRILHLLGGGHLVQLVKVQEYFQTVAFLADHLSPVEEVIETVTSDFDRSPGQVGGRYQSALAENTDATVSLLPVAFPCMQEACATDGKTIAALSARAATRRAWFICPLCPAYAGAFTLK